VFPWTPVVSRWANQVFVTQTFARWHWGIGRAAYADAWLEQTGPLSADEMAAAARLRTVFQRSEGARLLRALLPFDTREEGEASARSSWSAEAFAAWESARAAFVARFDALWTDGEPALRRHADTLSLDPPAWLGPAIVATDRFFGLDGSGAPLRVWLLLSAPGWDGGNGPMLTGPGGMTWECSGLRTLDGALGGFIHEVMHAVHQPVALPPLLRTLLAEPDLAGIEPAAYQATPIAAHGVGFEDYLGELALHSLWPDGALARRYFPAQEVGLWRRFARAADVYECWVHLPAGVLALLTRTYVDQGWPIDLPFLRHAYDVHAALRRILPENGRRTEHQEV
jgi:hypothetical protein